MYARVWDGVMRSGDDANIDFEAGCDVSLVLNVPDDDTSIICTLHNVSHQVLLLLGIFRA